MSLPPAAFSVQSSGSWVRAGVVWSLHIWVLVKGLIFPVRLLLRSGVHIELINHTADFQWEVDGVICLCLVCFVGKGARQPTLVALPTEGLS